jgi:hypothetical protein
MNISLVHPSFKRPRQAHDCYKHWVMKSDNACEYEWIISLSDNDPTASQYIHIFRHEPVTIISTGATNMVMASNAGAKIAGQDILILVSDDMFAPHGWDSILLDWFARHPDPAVLQVHDGIRSDILTIPIMNRGAYERLGYLYHPKYISMFADNDLTETAKAHGMYHVDESIEIEHRHYTVGKSQLDETYKRENSATAWTHGQRLFNQRQKIGFPL